MPRGRHSSQKNYPPFRSAVVQTGLLLTAVAAVFLAGSVRQGSTGIFLTVAGAAMIFFAPNRSVPWKYWVLCGGILGSSALCLLPQAWFYTPEWRLGLQAYQGLPPLPFISLAPRESIYWMVLLAGALLTGLFSLGHPVRSGVKVYLATGGALACATYAGVAIYAKLTGWEYPFFDKGGWSPPDFGFFPNRNHTAAFLVTGSILGLGLLRDAWSNRRPVVFVLSGASLGLCVYALLFHSISRGGVVFLVVGIVVWVAVLGRSHRSVPLLVSAVGIGAAMIGLFLASEGMARDRVLEMLGLYRAAEVRADAAPEVMLPAGDLRFRIFNDTARILRDYPLTGTGLGTYAYVFPFYMRESIDEAMPVHPESDWLMLAAEAGLPAVGLALLLLVVLIRDLLPLRQSPTWPLRWGIVAAALVAILHGMVDVPLHRVELGWWVLVLAGLAFGYPTPTETERSTGWLVQRLIFGISGAALLAMGVMLVCSQWYGEPPFPPYRAKVAVDQMRQLVAAGRAREATNLARSEIPLSPMERGLYRELGYREIRNGGDPIVADAVFAAERALNPVSAKIPLDQGNLWLRDDPLRAGNLWGEALRKHMLIEKGGGYANAVEFYQTLLSRATPHPELFAALGEYARLTPKLWLVWVTRAPKGQIEEAAKDADFLRTLAPPQRRGFLVSWWNAGNREALDGFLANNPAWESEAWPVRLRQMVARKDYMAALEAVRARYHIDLELPRLDAETLQGAEPPYDLAEMVAWFVARGNVVSARRMVSESAQARQPEGLRLKCILAVQGGDWGGAWEAMEGYLRETKRGDLP